MTTTPDPRPSAAPGRAVVEFARRAPSVHNTQPWAWRIGERSLDLYADRSRQLPVADPEGRMLTISCGAALHYAVAGAAAAGWSARTALLPDPSDPDLLARVNLRPGEAEGLPTREATARAELLADRTTDRRRFIGWPIPGALLQALADEAGHGPARARPMTTTAERVRVELLMSRALSMERTDPRFAAEQDRWTDRPAGDGVPADNAVPPPHGHLEPLWPSRFDVADDLAAAGWTLATHADGIVVIVTEEDTPTGWLAAGDVLCRLWTAAMEHDLSLVPLSQVVEVPEVREILRRGVVEDAGHPALVVRIGWQEIARRALPRTPRRDLDDLLRP